MDFILNHETDRLVLYFGKKKRTFAGEPEEMGARYAAIAEAARMHSLPDDEKIQYFRNMITEEERLDIGGAYCLTLK